MLNYTIIIMINERAVRAEQKYILLTERDGGIKWEGERVGNKTGIVRGGGVGRGG